VLGVLSGGSALIDVRQERIIEELGIRQRGQTESVDDFATSLFSYGGLLTSVILGELRPTVAARRVPRHVELMVGYHDQLLDRIGARLDPILVSTTRDMMQRMPALGEEMQQAFANDQRDRLTALNDTWRTRAVTFNSLVREARRSIQAESDRNLEIAHGLTAQGRWMNIIGLSVGLLGLALTWLVLVQLTARPLGALAQAMERLAHGQVDTAVPGTTRRDQVGDMARTLLVFRENLLTTRRLSEQALAGARRTAVATHQASDAIGQISEGATTQLAELREVAEALGHTSDAIREVSRITQGSHDQTEAARTLLAESLRKIGTLLDVVEAVGEDTTRVTRIATTIAKVAIQTNILAINAAIEAARAGEQGRGFAVVADEVRSLSQRTQSSTAQIAGTVDSLRSTVNEAVSLMEAACGQAQSDAQAVTGLGERLGEIASAVQGVTATLAQIATAVEEQASTADEVSGNIQQVDQAAVRLLEGARAVNQAADTLSHGSKALSANTGRFQLN
jgi:methyl-accepting chemotaxis protein